ncbi:MAG TPA: tRNA (adenosine(37)-N6)-threonylcarbamoyltransferase complex ATPase subunit type 1 TsaE, partial [Rubrobacter sp.]|nr:tRNA (adenosine(37)-N6)-threonylcarbamoyltransferase complex ATPase subunit type 1 TsaE [Rubrobacter sp.]
MTFEGLEEAALQVLASKVARALVPGDVVVLSGEVGSGKTTFVRAAALALGVTERVTSPTYQLARGYEGLVDGRRVVVNHMDLYRLEGIEDR